MDGEDNHDHESQERPIIEQAAVEISTEQIDKEDPVLEEVDCDTFTVPLSVFDTCVFLQRESGVLSITIEVYNLFTELPINDLNSLDEARKANREFCTQFIPTASHLLKALKGFVAEANTAPKRIKKQLGNGSVADQLQDLIDSADDVYSIVRKGRELLDVISKHLQGQDPSELDDTDKDKTDTYIHHGFIRSIEQYIMYYRCVL